MFRRLINRSFFAKHKNLQSHQMPDLPLHNAGIKTISKQVLKKYQISKLKDISNTLNQRKTLNRSVQSLKTSVLEDPILKLSLQAGISEIQKGGILHGATLDQVFEAINHVCTEPPKFADKRFIGLPFAYLFVDLLQTRLGRFFFGSKIVNQKIRDIFNQYNLMLNSKVSLKYLTQEEPNGWLSQTAQKYVDYSEYYVDKSKPHWGFQCWNDWFTRAIRPESRPVDPRPNSIVHSSDSFPLYFKPGQLGRNPYRNVKAEDAFWLKDSLYSLYDTLGAKKMGITDLVDEHFVGGTVYQAFLDPWCYHRWHSPVSGTVVMSYKLEGSYFFINPNIESTPKPNLTTYVDSLPMLSTVSTRHVYIIRLDDGSDRYVALIEIGMTQVSTCKSIVIEGQYVSKGEQIGRFEYGGSSYLMIFDKEMDLTFNPSISVLNSKINSTNKHLVNSWLAIYQ